MSDVIRLELDEMTSEDMAPKRWTSDAIEVCRSEIACVLSSIESISGHRYKTARELLGVSELKVSCEFLCEHIAEDNLPLLADDRKRLVDICTLLGVDAHYYTDLTDSFSVDPIATDNADNDCDEPE